MVSECTQLKDIAMIFIFVSLVLAQHSKENETYSKPVSVEFYDMK